MSDWRVMNADEPQGSCLGPLMFIVTIIIIIIVVVVSFTVVDSLRTSCPMHKFVDDTTLSEFVAKSTTNCMKACCGELVHQSEEIRMNGKTKEMLIGPMAKDPPPLLSLFGTTVERVLVFKLLGVHVSSDFVSGRNTSTLWFPRQRHVCTFLSSWGELNVPTRHCCSAAGPRLMRARCGTVDWPLHCLTYSRRCRSAPSASSILTPITGPQ